MRVSVQDVRSFGSKTDLIHAATSSPDNTTLPSLQLPVLPLCTYSQHLKGLSSQMLRERGDIVFVVEQHCGVLWCEIALRHVDL